MGLFGKKPGTDGNLRVDVGSTQGHTEGAAPKPKMTAGEAAAKAGSAALTAATTAVGILGTYQTLRSGVGQLGVDVGAAAGALRNAGARVGASSAAAPSSSPPPAAAATPPAPSAPTR